MNRKQKRGLYEAVMKSVRKSLNESENYTYEDVNNVEQYYYIITLQDGTEVYNSLDDDISFDSYKEAEYECDSKLDEIVDSQADDEDAFMIGDYRTKIISM